MYRNENELDIFEMEGSIMVIVVVDTIVTLTIAGSVRVWMMMMMMMMMMIAAYQHSFSLRFAFRLLVSTEYNSYSGVPYLLLLDNKLQLSAVGNKKYPNYNSFLLKSLRVQGSPPNNATKTSTRMLFSQFFSGRYEQKSQIENSKHLLFLSLVHTFSFTLVHTR
jgi:hypothetical protein